jgi:hypothetical protein
VVVLSGRRVLTEPAVDLPRNINTWDREPFGNDQRLYFIPSARLLVVLPSTNDKLELYRVDPDELLARSEYDYLVVTSRPPGEAARGATFRYLPAVKSNSGGLKYKLESGPDGMKIGADGSISWQVPNGFADKEVDVIVSISNSAGQEAFHTFKISIRDKG